MKLADRIKVERAAVEARAGVLRAVREFVKDVENILDDATAGRKLAEILTIEGVIEPAPCADDVVTLSLPGHLFPPRPSQAALWPATEGFDATEPEGADLAELEEMVAAPDWTPQRGELPDELPAGVKAPAAGLLYGKPATAEDLAMAELKAKAPATQQSPSDGETGGPSGAGKAAEPTATAETSSPMTAAGQQSAPDAPELKSGPLDDDERMQVLELVAEGLTPAEIADRLFRPRRGFHLVVKNLVAAAETEEQEAEGPDTEGPEPVSSLGFTCAPPPGAPLKVRELHRFLDRLGYPDPWTPAKDAILATMLANGEGLVNTVTALKLDRNQVKARWDALLPVKGIDEQSRLVAALQERNAIYDLRRNRGAQAAEAAE